MRPAVNTPLDANAVSKFRSPHCVQPNELGAGKRSVAHWLFWKQSSWAGSMNHLLQVVRLVWSAGLRSILSKSLQREARSGGEG